MEGFDISKYKSDYERIFGRKQEAWRVPLGALILTLEGGGPNGVDIDRARHEVEELKYVLNRLAGAPVPVRD